MDDLTRKTLMTAAGEAIHKALGEHPSLREFEQMARRLGYRMCLVLEVTYYALPIDLTDHGAAPELPSQVRVEESAEPLGPNYSDQEFARLVGLKLEEGDGRAGKAADEGAGSDTVPLHQRPAEATLSADEPAGAPQAGETGREGDDAQGPRIPETD